MIVTACIDKCNSCLKSRPEVAVIINKNWGATMKVKLLCNKCYFNKKLEGTIYK